MNNLQEIENTLDEGVENVFDNPSASKHADWKLWRSIFAYVIWLFVQVMNRNKVEVEALAESRHTGNIEWYYSELMKFQGEDVDGQFIMDELLVDNSGVVRFISADENRRLITHMSLIETSEGVLHIKAAKTEGDKVVRLTDSERIAFMEYVRKIKYPGLRWALTADNPDMIRYDITVYHNSVNPSEVQSKLTEIMKGYQNTLGFDDKFYPQRFVEHIRKNVDDVVTIKLNALQAKAATEENFINAGVVYTLQAGYFNFCASQGEDYPSVITLKHIDELVL